MSHTLILEGVYPFNPPKLRPMNALELKLNLIKHITQIEDVSLLQRMQAFLNTSGSLYNDTMNEVPSLRNNKIEEFNDKEDFTDYIKEWVKDM